MRPPVRVEVWMDVLCPWCYIAQRRVDAAVRQMGGSSRVEVVWRSFELGPHLGRMPGRTAADEMRDGGWWGEQAELRIARIRALGAAEGIELDLEAARPVSSFDAHRLVHLGADRGRGDLVVERLLRAYHTEGRNIADGQVLRDAGLAVGLDEGDVDRVLTGDAYAGAVRADERRAVELGVNGVPTTVVAGGAPIPGLLSVGDLRRLVDGAVDGDTRPVPGDRGPAAFAHRSARGTA